MNLTLPTVKQSKKYPDIRELLSAKGKLIAGRECTRRAQLPIAGVGRRPAETLGCRAGESLDVVSLPSRCRCPTTTNRAKVKYTCVTSPVSAVRKWRAHDV